nr:PREDICTED: uncharacterized protein LOC105669363 [Linepithema humile]
MFKKMKNREHVQRHCRVKAALKQLEISNNIEGAPQKQSVAAQAHKSEDHGQPRSNHVARLDLVPLAGEFRQFTGRGQQCDPVGCAMYDGNLVDPSRPHGNVFVFTATKLRNLRGQPTNRVSRRLMWRCPTSPDGTSPTSAAPPRLFALQMMLLGRGSLQRPVVRPTSSPTAQSSQENEVGSQKGSRDGSPKEGARTVTDGTLKGSGSEAGPAARQEVSPPARKNRCGAERRRAKRMRAATLEGARSLPVASPCTPVEVVKRHADGKRRKGFKDTPPSGDRPLKKQRTRDGQHAYSDAADPLARVIVAEGYPETGITVEQLTLLRDAVLEKIDGIQEGPVSRFHGTSLRSGAAVVRCADGASLDWLVGRIGGITPWEGARLRVMGLDALQKQHRAVVWVPGTSQARPRVLKRLEKQNPGLITGSWKVFAEGVGTTREGGNLVLGVPGSSVLKLKTGLQTILWARQGCLSAFTQVNLHHSKGASAVLARQQAGRQTCISLMQEPWVIRGCIRGLAACGRLFRAPSVDRPRACVAVKGMEAQLIPHLCSRDVAAVEVNFTDDSGDRKKMVICSAYFSHDEGKAVPPVPVIKLAEYCQENGFPLIMRCDANAHHTVWGSSDTNDRGRKVLEFLASTDLEILNTGDEPTFCTIARREVLDITVCSKQLIQKVVEWRVSTEPSLSDHRQISFRIAKARGKEVKFRNPRKTKWDSYREDLANSLKGFPKRHGTEDELETCMDYLQRSLVNCYKSNCPERAVTNSRGTSWWTPGLQGFRVAARRAWNRARNTGRQSDWELSRRAQKDYRDSVVRAKLESCRKFCEEVEGMPETARICRILARNPDATLEAITLPDGTVVTGERCLEHLLEVSFPGFHREQEELFAYKEPGSLRRARQADWRMAAKIVMPEKVKAFIAMGYTPSAWKLARVVFIPKARRTSYTKAKDFRPISLTSFLLKTLEKLVDAYLRETTLWSHPLHKNQHAYRWGYFTETALHQTVAFIEEQLERRGYAVGAFLDIKGAFNNTPHEVVCEEAARKGVPIKLVEWIRGMLGRRVMTLLGTAKICGWVGRGCPQGGVLSPLLWCLVADGLLRALDDRGFTTQGYADDVAILVRGPFLETLLELMHGALEVVEEWCQRTGLAVNPLKTGLTVFTRKYKVGTIVGPTLGGVRLVPTESVKYLGVILDKKLLWEEHLRNRCKSLCQYFWTCRRTFGQTWGLKPSMIHWIYTAILCPRLTYAAVVWWTRVQKKTAKVALEHVRALILRRALGAMVTTPVAAMGVMFGIEPFHQVVVAAAAMAAYRLRCELKWKKGARHTRLPEDVLLDPIFEMRQDRIPIIRVSDRRFKVHIPRPEEWEKEGGNLGARTVRSRVEEGEHIRICTDSQAAIKALGAPTITSWLVRECRCVLNELAREREVTVTWVPGHSGIQGNECADQLAKAGSELTMVGPGPALGIPFCLGKGRIKEWLRREHLRHWRVESESKCRQARALMGDTPNRELTWSIRALSRKDARTAVHILTDHGTSLHVLGDCPAHTGLRHRMLGSALLGPEQIRELPVRDLILFWRKTGLLNIYQPFIVALCYENSKPHDINEFMDDFIKEINILHRDGIDITNKHFSVALEHIICDIPARKFLKQIKGYGDLKRIRASGRTERIDARRERELSHSRKPGMKYHSKRSCRNEPGEKNQVGTWSVHGRFKKRSGSEMEKAAKDVRDSYHK